MRTILFTMIMMTSLSVFAADAKVVATEPVYTNSTQYREVCTPVTENRRSIGGTFVGGVIGAAIGNQVGGGSGQDIATALGAVTGAAVGQNVAGDRTVTRTQCTRQAFTVQEISQYKVTVNVNGTFYTVYRSFSPQTGSLIPVNLSVN